MIPLLARCGSYSSDDSSNCGAMPLLIKPRSKGSDEYSKVLESWGTQYESDNDATLGDDDSSTLLPPNYGIDWDEYSTISGNDE